MAMTPYSQSPLVISILGTTPQERGLETQQFKAKFDEGLKEFTEWFNATHKTEFELVQTDLATHLADYAASAYKTLGSLAVDSDLNIQGDIGLYRLASPTYTNMPSAFSGYGILEIKYGNANGYMVQEIVQVNNGNRWARSTSAAQSTVKAGTATWLGWKQIITSDEISSGTGSPEGVTTASVGTLYRRTDVGELYVKKTGTGNTGWGKVTVA